MKTIIAEAYQKQKIMHDLASQSNGIVTGVQVLSLRSLMQEDRDDPTGILLQLQNALQGKKESFPIYAQMFRYPAFLQEILSFAKECLLWGISAKDLPADNDNEKELQKILDTAFSLDLAEKKIFAHRNTMIEELTQQDLTLSPAFFTSYDQYVIYQELQKTFPIKKESVSPALSLRYSLNSRQEIEAAAQEICRQQKTCNIILADYTNQYPVVKQVFERYGIPFSCIKEEEELHVPIVFAALSEFAMHKDRASYLRALRQDAFSQPCPIYLINYLDQCMQDDLTIGPIAEAVASSPFSKEADAYAGLAADYQSYFTSIQEEYDLLVSSSAPQEIFLHAYHVLQRSPLLKQPHEFKAAASIRASLQTIIPDCTDSQVPFFIEVIRSMHSSSSLYPTDFCMVTDLSHPVSLRDTTYVLGCSGRNYPGFPSLRGLFDEAYVSRISGYPTLTQRHHAYMEQLHWIEQSASSCLVYSYPTNDYAGHEIELALDVESLFTDHKAEKWKLDVLKQPAAEDHHLDPDTAHQLFTKDNVVSGSISTIERWFSCPYAYFIQSGLHVRGPQFKANDAASIGSIQHAFLETSVKEKQKTYSEVSEGDIRTFLQPFFDTLSITHPHETARMKVTQERMIQGLLTSCTFLKDMEMHTSFTPVKAEEHFEEPMVDGVSIHGIIDRIDSVNDVYRILDYKSSSHSLSEKNVKAGISLQLLTYLIVAQKQMQTKPLGAYYFSLKDENFSHEAANVSRNVVSDVVMNDDLLKERLIKQRRMRGWTFMDRSVELDDDTAHIVSAKKLMNYDLVEECIKQLYTYFHDHLLNGEIDLSPVEGACTFCEYRSICRFSGDYRAVEPLVMADQELAQSKEAK